MPLLTPIVVVWSTSAVLSAGYLFTLAVAPHWLSDLTPASIRVSGTDMRAPSPTETRLVAEVEGLREQVTALESDVDRLRQEAVAVRETLNNEVGSLKAAFAGSVPASDESETSAGPADDRRQTTSTTVPPPLRRPQTVSTAQPAGNTAPEVVPGAESDTAAIVPRVLNETTATKAATQTTAASSPPTARPVETGSVTAAAAKAPAPQASVEAEPVAFGPAVVTRPDAPQLGVVISSGETVDGLRLSWSALTERYGGLLGGLQPRYMLSTDPSGASFQLIAGPFSSEADAQATCREIRAANLPCYISSYGGNAL